MAEVISDGFAGSALAGVWEDISTGSGDVTVAGGTLTLVSSVADERALVRLVTPVASMADGDTFTVEAVDTGGGQFLGGVYLGFDGDSGTLFMPGVAWNGVRFTFGYFRRDTPGFGAGATNAPTDGKTFARLRRSGSTLICETAATYGGTYTTIVTLTSADGYWGFASFAGARPYLYANKVDTCTATIVLASLGDGSAPGAGGPSLGAMRRRLMMA